MVSATDAARGPTRAVGPAAAAEAAPAGRGGGAAGNPATGQARPLTSAQGVPSSVEGRGSANDGLDASGSNPQATPIVLNGVMYLPARGNQVLALEADTGKEMWRHLLPR